MKRGLWMMLWVLTGCGGVSTQLDNNSDGDEVRDQATGLFLDMTRTDSIDGGEGDNTDWTYLDVIDPGGLRISVGFDNPERLEGAYVSLFDEFGKRLDRRLIVANTTSYVFDRDVEKVPNKFYIQVFTQDGKSVYSLGARIALAPTAQPRRVVPVSQPDPEPEQEPEPEARVSKVRCAAGMRVRRGNCVCKRGYDSDGRGGCKKRAAAVKPPPVDAPVAPTTQAPVVAAVKSSGRSYTGRVTRVLPGANGDSVTIVISFDEPGVTKGDRGQLFKNDAPLAGASVQITKASGKAAKAYVPVASSEVSNGKLTVKITTR